MFFGDGPGSSCIVLPPPVAYLVCLSVGFYALSVSTDWFTISIRTIPTCELEVCVRAPSEPLRNQASSCQNCVVPKQCAVGFLILLRVGIWLPGRLSPCVSLQMCCTNWLRPSVVYFLKEVGMLQQSSRTLSEIASHMPIVSPTQYPKPTRT